MNDLELMKVHSATLFLLDSELQMLRVNDWTRREAPLLWVGLTREGLIWRYRTDVPSASREVIDPLVVKEKTADEDGVPEHHEVYASVLGSRKLHSGPTYYLPRAASSKLVGEATSISPKNSALLERGELADWIPDIPHQQPMFASVVGDAAFAVCASVRITDAAHEVGVETANASRKAGHGSRVVEAWAQALLSKGIIPLYSTTWDNLASQALAARVGFQRYGWEFSVG